MPNSSRLSAFLAYLLLPIGWLYVFLAHRDDRLAVYHARQSIMLVAAAVIAPVVWAVAGWLLAIIPLVGPPLSVSLFALVIAVYAVLVFNWVLGMVYAWQSKIKPLPLTGRWAERLPF
jgi:uncharacterized membrane protein